GCGHSPGLGWRSSAGRWARGSPGLDRQCLFGSWNAPGPPGRPGTRPAVPIRSAGRPSPEETSPRRTILDQIDYEKLLIPINKFYALHVGGPRRPVFYDIAATRPELLEFDRNYPVIREELLGILP